MGFTKEDKTKLEGVVTDTVTLLIKNAMTGKYRKEYSIHSIIGKACVRIFTYQPQTIVERFY